MSNLPTPLRRQHVDDKPAGGSKSLTATGSSQCGQAPPGPIRRQNTPQSSHRCSPK